jgi:hypothetical protein
MRFCGDQLATGAGFLRALPFPLIIIIPIARRSSSVMMTYITSGHSVTPPHETKDITKNGVFWVVWPGGPGNNRRFGGTWRLLHQGDKIGELGTTQAATSNRRTLRRNTKFLQVPHGVTTQKTPFFIVTAVKTSNLT